MMDSYKMIEDKISIKLISTIICLVCELEGDLPNYEAIRIWQMRRPERAQKRKRTVFQQIAEFRLVRYIGLFEREKGR